MYNKLKYKQPPIIYFHSVAPQKNFKWVRSYLTLELEYFEDILKFINKKKYKTFFISEMDNDYYRFDDSIGLSFDDGYLDNYVYVFPLLEKYQIKATIFCSLDYIDKRDITRPTIQDVWERRVEKNDIQSWGFCSPNELRIMEKSDLVDIQSHTITHDKITVSDKIIDFHNPYNTNINFILRENSDIKPYYIGDAELVNSIPFGFPLFEEKSAILSTEVFINNNFKEEVVKNLSNYNWNQYNFNQVFNSIKPILTKYADKNELVVNKETEDQYFDRIKIEISSSKKKLENMLNKKISVICWPHGDYNQIAVDIAVASGFDKIHFVETKHKDVTKRKEHFTRIGISPFKENKMISNLKFRAQIYDYQEKKVYQFLGKIFRMFT